MNCTNKNAGVQPGADTTYFISDYTPPNAAALRAACGKQAAFALFNHGVLSLEGCTRLFRQHFEWVSA